jgi:hypothetical protein
MRPLHLVPLAALLIAAAAPDAAAERCGPRPEHANPCADRCRIASSGAPPHRFAAGLAALEGTTHRLDSALPSRGWSTVPDMAFHTAFFPERWWTRWLVSGRFRGPCADLEAAFRSKLIDRADARLGLDVWALRYRSDAAARRVEELLEVAWDWNKHPLAIVRDGRDLLVIEGRHRDPRGLRRARDHFARFAPGR